MLYFHFHSVQNTSSVFLISSLLHGLPRMEYLVSKYLGSFSPEIFWQLVFNLILFWWENNTLFIACFLLNSLRLVLWPSRVVCLKTPMCTQEDVFCGFWMASSVNKFFNQVKLLSVAQVLYVLADFCLTVWLIIDGFAVSD